MNSQSQRKGKICKNTVERDAHYKRKRVPGRNMHCNATIGPQRNRLNSWGQHRMTMEAQAHHLMEDLSGSRCRNRRSVWCIIWRRVLRINSNCALRMEHLSYNFFLNWHCAYEDQSYIMVTLEGNKCIIQVVHKNRDVSWTIDNNHYRNAKDARRDARSESLV